MLSRNVLDTGILSFILMTKANGMGISENWRECPDGGLDPPLNLMAEELRCFFGGGCRGGAGAQAVQAPHWHGRWVTVSLFKTLTKPLFVNKFCFWTWAGPHPK